MRAPRGESPAPGSFPDLCRPGSLLTVFFLAELIVLIPTLVPAGERTFAWGDFALLTLFAQLLALWNAATLCALRPRLAALPAATGLVIAYLLVLTITAAGTLAAHWIDGLLELRPGLPRATAGEALLATVPITALVAAAALRYFQLQLAWRRQVEASAGARLQALEARIRPHFLFNALNSIAALTRRDPAAAERAIEDLSDLFRATIGRRDRSWTLGDELGACRRYVAIEGLRLGDRLRVHWAVDSLPAGAALPALTLQPLIENAIQHGIGLRRDGGEVRIEGERRGDRTLSIVVSNPLPGDGSRQRGGAGQALENVRQRLMLRFAGRATLVTGRTVGRETDETYRATLTWPMERPGDGASDGEQVHEGADRR